MLITIYTTILVKEILRFMRIWIQTILPPIIVTALYLLIFGGLMGDRIGDMDGIRYIEYISPGVILMAAIMNSYSNTVSSFYLVRFNRSIEEILVSPTPNWLIFAGFVSGGIVRGIVVGMTVFIVTWLFVGFKMPNVMIFFSTLILTTALFSIAGFINAIFAKSFDDISIVPNFILMPLIYLGGMFYDIKILPDFWQSVSLYNPIFYMMDGFRASFFANPVEPIWYSQMILIIMIIVLIIITLFIIPRSRWHA